MPRGTPRCAGCKAALPWVVAADESSFAEESEASVPVLVDFPLLVVLRDQKEVDRVVGAMPKSQLADRLAVLDEAAS